MEAQNKSEMNSNPDHKCIHCGSRDLVYSEQAQGFGAGKAIAGAVVFGPLGLVAGAINKNKMHVIVRCNSCLQTFTAAEMLEPERLKKKEDENKNFIAKAGPKEFIGFSVIAAFPFAGVSYLFLSGLSFGARYLMAMGLMIVMLFIQKKRVQKQNQ